MALKDFKKLGLMFQNPVICLPDTIESRNLCFSYSMVSHQMTLICQNCFLPDEPLRCKEQNNKENNLLSSRLRCEKG